VSCPREALESLNGPRLCSSPTAPFRSEGAIRFEKQPTVRRARVKVTMTRWHRALPETSTLSGESVARVRCSRGLGGLAIHIFAISDSDDEHHQIGVGD
jgi:hypothetical protein